MSARVYVRKFDHDAARARHAAGESYLTIARDLGVSDAAVRRVCDPAVRARMQEATDRYQHSGVCRDCGKKGVSPYYGRCRECASLASATTVRPDSLHCVTCDEWKPDDAFAKGVTAARRYRHQQCRVCATGEKARWRERHPEKYAATIRRDNERRRQRKVAA